MIAEQADCSGGECEEISVKQFSSSVVSQNLEEEGLSRLIVFALWLGQYGGSEGNLKHRSIEGPGREEYPIDGADGERGNGTSRGSNGNLSGCLVG